METNPKSQLVAHLQAVYPEAQQDLHAILIDEYSTPEDVIIHAHDELGHKISECKLCRELEAEWRCPKQPNLRIIHIVLPESFPEYFLPEGSKYFFDQLIKLPSFDKSTMPASVAQPELVDLAVNSGYRPFWKPLPHLGNDVFGLGMTIDGVGIPFMVKVVKVLRRINHV